MFINYYQLETLARMQNQERLAAATKEQQRYLLAKPARATMPWGHWLREQKAKWLTVERTATIEPAR